MPALHDVWAPETLCIAVQLYSAVIQFSIQVHSSSQQAINGVGQFSHTVVCASGWYCILDTELYTQDWILNCMYIHYESSMNQLVRTATWHHECSTTTSIIPVSAVYSYTVQSVYSVQFIQQAINGTGLLYDTTVLLNCLLHWSLLDVDCTLSTVYWNCML